MGLRGGTGARSGGGATNRIGGEGRDRIGRRGRIGWRRPRRGRRFGGSDGRIGGGRGGKRRWMGLGVEFESVVDEGDGEFEGGEERLIGGIV